MRKSNLLFVFISAIIITPMVSAQHHPVHQPVRKAEKINFDWRFKHDLSSTEISIPADNDPDWQLVNLPHDASIHGPFVKDSLNSDRKNGYRPRMKGWYKKILFINDSLQGKKVFIEFEGIYRDAHVFFNNQLMIHQLNGFQGFQIDVTDLVRKGKNTLAVHYDNTDIESSRWYNGEGIYRDVWLLITSATHINYNGVYITTPTVSSHAATIDIGTEVINSSRNEATLKLTSLIYDRTDKQIAAISNVVPIPANQMYTFNQSVHITHPHLWDTDNPYLYKVKTLITKGDTLVDQVETMVGIRAIEFDRDHGLLINGKKVLVKGVNLHHDLGPLGAAAFERGFERRLEGLKKLGCNAIRLAHNPHDKFILDWCDNNGMLVFDEAFDKWDDQFFGQGNNFKDHWRSSLEWFIRRDRNHPSVFIWSVGNETRQQRDPRDNFGIPMMKEMADFVHRLEPTRPVTCGLHPSRARGTYRTKNYYSEGPPEMEFYMDVVSTNYREEFWPVDRAHYPQLTFILSEAQVGNLGNEWFNFNHDYGVGLFYWGGTDYLGESFGWPAKGWPNGIVDWNDHWKTFSYYIHSLYSNDPMVHVAVYDPKDEKEKYWNEVQLRYQPMFSHWNWQGRDSVHVFTFTNAEEVELFINGKSMGTKQVPMEYHTKNIKAYTAEEYDPNNPINTGPELHKKLEWIVPYASGSISAIASIKGQKVVEHKLETAGEPYAIALEPDRIQIKPNGLDLSYITVKVVDRDGRIVPYASHDIHFDLNGAGTIAGVGNADILSDELFVADHRKVFMGKALLIVRSDRNPGKISITATAKKLKPAKVSVEVKE